MKKSILFAFCGALALTSSALANYKNTGNTGPCQYTLLQNIIRDARGHEKIFELIRSGVPMDDQTITCGGSLLQLAIRRGNASIVNGILAQDKSRANSVVSLSDFRISGAPDSVPVILFAAYYAPSETVFKVMVDAGADISVKDTNGHDILWYLDKNPVLRRSNMEDTIQAALQKMLLEQARQTSQGFQIQNKPTNLTVIKEQDSTVKTPVGSFTMP